jgi:predicted porin
MDTRLFLKAEAKADNGLVYGFDSRIRTVGGAGNNTGMILDKKVVYAKGSWGSVFLGDWDDSRTQLEVLNPQVGIGQADTNMNPVGHSATEYWASEGTFRTKATYMSPSFSGFQAGISYTPELDSGRSIFKGTPGVPGDRLSDQIDLAAGYTGTFGSVGLKVGGGYGLAQGHGPTLNDGSSWNLGAQVSFAGFTVGGFFFNQDADMAAGWGSTVDYSYGAGVTYGMGPWGIGASAIRSEILASSATDSAYGIGGAYRLAPGLSLQADVTYLDAESIDNTGYQLVLRTRVDF